MWTTFFDMHSGGIQKTEWPVIHIELSLSDAVSYFESKFDISPYNVTCLCCGEDYDIEEIDKEPVNDGTCLKIYKKDIYEA